MKKDVNYIAGLEKAISKKYGKLAIQNPSKFWDKDKEEEYKNQLKEFVEKQRKSESSSEYENVDGVLISRKLLIKEGKIRCPTCKNFLKTINDDIYFTKFECCEGCFIKYVSGREGRWTTGWRPDNGR
tara:strand:+ start:728 stop:1111 length:384 start_codon:yes stop_codon:yes gene_type:complete